MLVRDLVYERLGSAVEIAVETEYVARRERLG
jgi:hypothetical protein